MTLIETVADDRPEHPVDVVERLAAINEWTFDRAQEDEISILVAGEWANYDVAFTWIPDIESLHVACSFDLKAPARKRAAALSMVRRAQVHNPPPPPPPPTILPGAPRPLPTI